MHHAHHCCHHELSPHRWVGRLSIEIRFINKYLALWRSRSWRGIFTDWPVVLIITPTEQRARLLKQATELTFRRQNDRGQVMAGTEFAFVALPQLTRDGPLADIWQVAGREEVSGLLPDAQSDV